MQKIKIPFWKKWLSYFIEFELERVESVFSNDLSLCLSDGKIQLNTEKAIYSWEDKYDNFYKAFAQTKWEAMTTSSVLSLGFGLGSIVQMLENNFHKNFYYTGIEYDENVIYLAEKYILHKLKSPVNIVQAPADVFVEICQEKYDLITIDVFVEDKIPHSVRNSSFLENTRELLNLNGLILMNHLAMKDEDIKQGKQFFKNVFLKVFPEASILQVDGNFIFFSNKKYLVQ
jgi:spermidine synthase